MCDKLASFCQRATAWTLVLSLVGVGATACASKGDGTGGSGDDGGPGGGGGDDSSIVIGNPTGPGDGGSLVFDSSIYGDTGSGVAGQLTISPMNPTITVTIVDGVVTSAPTQQFTAMNGSQVVRAGWTVDQGAIATITQDGVFTPTGSIGGPVQVTAGYGAYIVSTTATVVINRTQNGFMGAIDLTSAGGYGGVGGEGPGGAVSAGDKATLQTTPTPDASRSFLYPYTGTVWPRGLLAPLVQWTPGKADATAVAIHLASKTFVYDGYFGRPAALASASLFVRHPIPQDVWAQATDSTSGTDTLALSVVLLQGGGAVGPLTESWRVAPGRLQGTVYYESYGTLLVMNSDFLNGQVGAAVLSIKPGDTAPKVAAGTSTPAKAVAGTGCRACHSVAAKGGSLIVQDNAYPYSQTSLYNLQTLGETLVNAPPPSNPPYPLAWAALSPDGTYALTNGVWMGTDTDDPGGNTPGKTELYQVNATGTAAPVGVSGLPSTVAGATPTFSPDGAHVAFTHVAGTLGTLTGDGTHVVTLDFNASAAGGPAMSGAKNVFTTPAGKANCVGFPSFLPTNDALLMQLTLMACGDGSRTNTSFGQYIGTSKGAGAPGLPSEIWWTDVGTATQHRLDALNGVDSTGKMYLPTGPNGHGNDTQLNFEPTVSPSPSGGYAWVVFTSRRLYGNVATIDPFSSDPRNYDYLHQVTTKKLWVAAIDLNAPPGTDPSHPAFYLPAQELQAGNARGFWVFEPCRGSGVGCELGDQCCGGYCTQSDEAGAMMCGTTTTTCPRIGDKCVMSSQCCDMTAQCINGICSLPTPPIAK